MKKLLVCGAVLASLVSSAASADIAVDDWVLSQKGGGAFYYPGTATRITTSQVSVRYDSGETEVRPVNQVKEYTWKVGTKLQCKWTDGAWYTGNITFLGEDGTALSILYDDGDRLKTTTSNCRSW